LAFLLFYAMPEKPFVDDYDYVAYRKRVGERIKSVRIARGYTSYEKFAIAHDISRSLIYRYENNKANLQMESLLKVIKALGMTPAEFFSVGFNSW
jgi:transcriptional regulator with XRE-family HTH domain